jgi:hypothetical protein
LGKIKSQQTIQNMLGLVEAGKFDKAMKLGKGLTTPDPCSRQKLDRHRAPK